MRQLARGVLIIGSVPLNDAEEVFRTCGRNLGSRLISLPDGETGDRLSWLGHQRARFDRHPQLERASTGTQERSGAKALYRIKAGQKLRFESLGYSDFARASYEIFKRLQAQAILPQHLRFQVSMPTPLNMLSFFDSDDSEEVENAFLDAFRREVEIMVRGIGAEKLAIQWDLPKEVAILRGLYPFGAPDPQESIVSKLNDLSVAVPPASLLGVHLCCGDRHYRPIDELEDLAVLVAFANMLAKRLNHRLDWVQMPVPATRDDLDYFGSLSDLDIGSTTLYLGLVHHSDGIDGALRRIEVAKKVIPEFGATTECGLGRRDPETIQDLLNTLAHVSAAVS